MGGEGRSSRRCDGSVIGFDFDVDIDFLAGKIGRDGSLSKSEGEEENCEA